MQAAPTSQVQINKTNKPGDSIDRQTQLAWQAYQVSHAQLFIFVFKISYLSQS